MPNHLRKKKMSQRKAQEELHCNDAIHSQTTEMSDEFAVNEEHLITEEPTTWDDSNNNDTPICHLNELCSIIQLVEVVYGSEENVKKGKKRSRIFICSCCPRMFRSSSGRYRHMKKHHNNE